MKGARLAGIVIAWLAWTSIFAALTLGILVVAKLGVLGIGTQGGTWEMILLSGTAGALLGTLWTALGRRESVPGARPTPGGPRRDRDGL